MSNYSQYDLSRGWTTADDACTAVENYNPRDCTTLDKYCATIECDEYKAPIIYTDILRWILWANWTISFCMTLGGITYMYSKWVTIKILVKDWPYNMVVYKVPLKKLKGIIPLPLIKFGLFCKLVPSLVIDVIDILFDTMYFAELVGDQVLDKHIHIRPRVYLILFTFQITGTIKNAILVAMAVKKLTPKSIHAKTKTGSVIRTKEMDEDESLLRDTNGYMYITFLQTILAFLMQDAPEALTQYFYVDKYLTEANNIVFAACSIRFVMSVRVVFIYFQYVKKFVDPAYHSLKMRCVMWSMVLVKFIIFLAHGIRSIAVIKANSQKIPLSCYEHEKGSNQIYQGPWNLDCMDGVDIALLVLAGLSFVGVFVGVFAMKYYGDKVYNQSHYSGRTGMVSVGKELTRAIRAKDRFKRKNRDKKPTRKDSSEDADTIESLRPNIPPSRQAAGRPAVYQTHEEFIGSNTDIFSPYTTDLI